jgi:transposase
MEITRNQYEQIENCLPRQRGNVSLSNQQVLNAILYVAEHGCPWRRLPERFGNWHTIYTRMNRWSRQGVLDRVFARLQQSQIVRIKIEPVVPGGAVFAIHPVPKPSPVGTARNRPASPASARPAGFVWLPRVRARR